MSTYSIYVRNGVHWILSASDPNAIEFPAESPFAGWTLLTPLTLPANVIGREISYSALADGRMLVSSDRMDFLTHETDEDEALAVAQQILRWLRFSTGQARLGTDIVGHQIQPGDASHEILSLPAQATRAQPMRHVEFSGLTFALIRAALVGNPNFSVPIYSEVLLDAIEASFVSDIRKAIYSAIAVEVMASTRIEETFKRESVAHNGHLRLIEIDQSGGTRVKKDPIFEELRRGSERNFKLLLNHLPLYVSGQSMLTKNQDLYRELLLLHTTRNDLVHNASLDEGERMPLDYVGMRRAVDAAINAFQWFGATGRYVTLWRNELDAGWIAKDGMGKT